MSIFDDLGFLLRHQADVDALRDANEAQAQSEPAKELPATEVSFRVTRKGVFVLRLVTNSDDLNPTITLKPEGSPNGYVALNEIDLEWLIDGLRMARKIVNNL
jgi:hypothetical protein